MDITRIDPFSGKENTRDIPCTIEQLFDWNSGTLIQNAMPNLSPSEREFIMTGMMDDSWEEAFGDTV